MQQCERCGARFADQDAYQIHLGLDAPTFRACFTAEEMAANGMTVNKAGEWVIDKHFVAHSQGKASLKSPWGPRQIPLEPDQ